MILPNCIYPAPQHWKFLLVIMKWICWGFIYAIKTFRVSWSIREYTNFSCIPFTCCGLHNICQDETLWFCSLCSPELHHFRGKKIEFNGCTSILHLMPLLWCCCWWGWCCWNWPFAFQLIWTWSQLSFPVIWLLILCNWSQLIILIKFSNLIKRGNC